MPVLAAVLALLVASCAGGATPARTDAAVPEPSIHAGGGPIILWWSRYAKSLENITHVVNDVWIGNRDEPRDRHPDHHQDAWLERGIVPLDWAGGRVYASLGVDALADRWSRALSAGYLGLAIDEFGARDRSVDALLADALVQTRSRHPDALLAVWHGGLIHRRVAPAYRDAADLILLEAYTPGTTMLAASLGLRLANVRRYGLQSKTVVALSIGDPRFAGTSEEVEAQLRWLRANASDFAGIGFFAARADEELTRFADQLVGELW